MSRRRSAGGFTWNTPYRGRAPGGRRSRRSSGSRIVRRCKRTTGCSSRPVCRCRCRLLGSDRSTCPGSRPRRIRTPPRSTRLRGRNYRRRSASHPRSTGWSSGRIHRGSAARRRSTRPGPCTTRRRIATAPGNTRPRQDTTRRRTTPGRGSTRSAPRTIWGRTAFVPGSKRPGEFRSRRRIDARGRRSRQCCPRSRSPARSRGRGTSWGLRQGSSRTGPRTGHQEDI